jgi:outer membrane protein
MRLILTTILVLLPFLGWAQTRTITIEDAIEIALENNYQLKQAENTLDLRRIQERSAFADLFPSVSSNVQRGLSIGRQFDETTGRFDDLSINRLSVGFSSGVTIFNGFANINNLRSSRFEKQSQQEQLQRVRENIIFNTASGYLEYLLNQELLEIDLENLETANRQLEQVRAQVEVGARPNVDLLNQESAVADAELQVVNRENQLNMSRLNLIRQLQVDPLGDYEFVSPEIETEYVIPQEYDLRTLISAALENRSDLRSEENSIQATLHQLRATRANLYPSLNLNGSVGTSYSSVNPFSYTDQFFDQNISRSIGASISIPIFDNFNRRTNVRSQEINYRNALLSLENTKVAGDPGS